MPIRHATRYKDSGTNPKTMNIIRYKSPEMPPLAAFEIPTIQNLLKSALRLAGSQNAWAPPMDVYENEQALTVCLDVPGMAKESFEITLEEGALCVAGSRPQDEESPLRSERWYGTFKRSIALPFPVKENEVSATYENGVLSVNLIKSEEAKPKKITVS